MRRFLVLALVLWAAQAQASTFYVATTGDDSRSCATAQTITTPRATVNAGVACLEAGAAGDTLLIRAGTYTESILNPSLTGTNFTTGKYRIAAYPSEAVTIRPFSGQFVFLFAGTQAYVELDGLILDGSSVTQNVVKVEAYTIAPYSQTPSHIRIQNSELIGNTSATDGQCILLVAAGAGVSGFNEIVNNTIHGCGASTGSLPAWAIYNQSGDNLIDGNRIYNAPGGIEIYNGYGLSVNNTVIRNNIFYDLRATPAIPSDRHSGITIFNSGTGTLIYNNVFYHTPASTAGSISAAIYVGITGSGLGIYNNTIADNFGDGLFCESATAPTVRNNIMVGSVGQNFANNCSATNDHNYTGTTASAGFTSAATGDYTLTATSPAIDAGTTIATVAFDLLNAIRPQGNAYDEGAYEFGGIPNPPPPPPTTQPQKYKLKFRKP